MITPSERLPAKLLPRNGKDAFVQRRKMSIGAVTPKKGKKISFNKNRRSKGKDKSTPFGKERFIQWRKDLF